MPLYILRSKAEFLTASLKRYQDKENKKMAKFINEPSHTFNEYLLIPGYSSGGNRLWYYSKVEFAIFVKQPYIEGKIKSFHRFPLAD